MLPICRSCFILLSSLPITSSISDVSSSSFWASRFLSPPLPKNPLEELSLERDKLERERVRQCVGSVNLGSCRVFIDQQAEHMDGAAIAAT